VKQSQWPPLTAIINFKNHNYIELICLDNLKIVKHIIFLIESINFAAFFYPLGLRPQGRRHHPPPPATPLSCSLSYTDQRIELQVN